MIRVGAGSADKRIGEFTCVNFPRGDVMNNFFLTCIIILAVLILLCLVRAIRGPKIADRIMASNMIGTLTVAIILLLAVYINESYIIDVALVYAVISFLAVIVITRIYIGLYRRHKHDLITEAAAKEAPQENPAGEAGAAAGVKPAAGAAPGEVHA